MAGTTATTIQKCTAESTKGFPLQWRILTTALGHHLNVKDVDASKMIILTARDSTKAAGTQYIWLGTSDSACSGTSQAHPYSASKLHIKKIGSSKILKATAFTKLRASGSTILMCVNVLGPFETARYKDSDGYINISKGKLGSTTCWIGAILIP